MKKDSKKAKIVFDDHKKVFYDSEGNPTDSMGNAHRYPAHKVNADILADFNGDQKENLQIWEVKITKKDKGQIG